MIKVDRWIPSKMKTAFTEMNTFIYTKISTPIYTQYANCVDIILLFKVRSIQQNIYFLFHLFFHLADLP